MREKTNPRLRLRAGPGSRLVTAKRELWCWEESTGTWL